MNTRALVLVLSSALLACGGTAVGSLGDGGSGSGSGGSSGGGSGSSGGSSGGGSGSSSGGSSGGSSSGGLVAACPAQAPANGAACTESGLDCEYGSDPNASCDTRATCDGAKFTVVSAGQSSACPTPGPGQSSCPATYPGAQNGQSCSPEGVDCAFPQGRCACSNSFGGPIHVSPDGGAPAAVWQCEEPGQGCPEPRPRLGGACSSTGETCDYGSCTLPGGIAMVCSNGAWSETSIPCPL